MSDVISIDTVVAIQGNSVSSVTPIDGQVLTWDHVDGYWKPETPPSSLPPNGPAGGDLGGTYPNPSVIKLTGSGGIVNVNASLISNGNFNITSSTGQVDVTTNGGGAIIVNCASGGNIQLQISGNSKFFVDGTTMSFFGHSAATQQTVSGSKGGNAALASLISALASYGLIVDSTS